MREDTRLTVIQTADLIRMHPSHLQCLIRRGVFPGPRRTAKGAPYFDGELVDRITEVLRTCIGLNGDEVTFYRRRKKSNNRRTAASRPPATDPYLTDLAACLRQLGYTGQAITPAKLNQTLSTLFGSQRPAIEVAISKVLFHLR